MQLKFTTQGCKPGTKPMFGSKNGINNRQQAEDRNFTKQFATILYFLREEVYQTQVLIPNLLAPCHTFFVFFHKEMPGVRYERAFSPVI